MIVLHLAGCAAGVVWGSVSSGGVHNTWVGVMPGDSPCSSRRDRSVGRVHWVRVGEGFCPRLWVNLARHGGGVLLGMDRLPSLGGLRGDACERLFLLLHKYVCILSAYSMACQNGMQ